MGGKNNTEAMVRSARSHETHELITGENDLGETSQYQLPRYCSLFSCLITQEMKSTCWEVAENPGFPEGTVNPVKHQDMTV